MFCCNRSARTLHFGLGKRWSAARLAQDACAGSSQSPPCKDCDCAGDGIAEIEEPTKLAVLLNLMPSRQDFREERRVGASRQGAGGVARRQRVGHNAVPSVLAPRLLLLCDPVTWISGGKRSGLPCLGE